MKTAYVVCIVVVLAALMIATQIFTWRQIESPPQWEYKVVFLHELGIKTHPAGPQYDFDYGTLQQELARLGQEGWELAVIHHVMASPDVSMHITTPRRVEYHGVAVFKRRIAR